MIVLLMMKLATTLVVVGSKSPALLLLVLLEMNNRQSTGDTKSSTGRLLAGDIRTAGACCSFVSEWLWLTFVSKQPMV